MTTTTAPLAPQAVTTESRLARRLRMLKDEPELVAGVVAARLVRRVYARNLARVVARAPKPTREVGVTLWSFSSQRDLPEQVASIASFLEHAGRPRGWTIASDGSHTPEGVALLESMCPGVRVVPWTEVVGDALTPALARGAEEHPLGRKLALFTALPAGPSTLVADSDVLFLPGARAIEALVDAHAPAPSYQLDCENMLDPRLVDPTLTDAPTNTGVVALHAPLDYSAALEPFDRLPAGSVAAIPARVEQGITHLAMVAAGAAPFDPARVVISPDDRMRAREQRLADDAVLRHYAGPTRHLMWLRVARDALRR